MLITKTLSLIRLDESWPQVLHCFVIVQLKSNHRQCGMFNMIASDLMELRIRNLYMFQAAQCSYFSYFFSKFPIYSYILSKSIFLAHLSQRLTGELIGYPWIRPSVRSHCQTSSPLKPLGQSKPNFMWSLLGKGEPKFI